MLRQSVLYNESVAILASFERVPAPIYELIEEIDRICKLAGSYLGLTLTVGGGSALP